MKCRASSLLPSVAATAAVVTGTHADDGYFPRASLNTPRQESAAAILRSDVFVVGGLNAQGAALPSVERYSIISNAWTFVAPLPVGLDHLGVVAVADRLYAIGGYNGNFSPRRECYRYDPDKNEWAPI